MNANVVSNSFTDIQSSRISMSLSFWFLASKLVEWFTHSSTLFRFEDDPHLKSIDVTCQTDGFFEVPEEDNWENCLLGTYCEQPPTTPYEGTMTITPKVMQLETEELCAVDGAVLEIKCPSFQQIYVLGASYGREQ